MSLLLRAGSHRRSRSSDVPVALPDGGTARLRPLLPGEIGPVQAVFASLSTQSRVNRFLAPMPVLPPRMLAVLAAADGDEHVAWVASVLGRPVGVARYVRTGPATAEVAFEVADAHQGRGLGAALLDAVTTLACVSGIRRIQALVLAGNEPSRRLLTRIGVPLAGAGPELEGEGPLTLMDPPRVDRSAVLALAARTKASSPNGPWTPA